MTDLVPTGIHGYSKKILWWAIAGYLIRVMVAPFLVQVDFTTNSWASLILAQEHRFVVSNDPPLNQFFLAGWYTILKPLLPTAIYYEVGSQVAFSPPMISNMFRLSQPGVYSFLLLSKIPYILLDLGVGVILLWLLEERYAVRAFKLWMINPISIFITAIVGQYDVIPVFFFMLSLYFLKRGSPVKMAVSVGIAGAFKLFTFLLLPPLLYVSRAREQNSRRQLAQAAKIAVISTLPFAASFLAMYMIPVYYETLNFALVGKYGLSGFYGTTRYYNGSPQQPFMSGLFLFFLNFSVGLKTFQQFTDTIYVFPIIYVVFLLSVLAKKDWSFEESWKAILVFFLLFYAFDLFLVHWFLWGLPLLVLLVSTDWSEFKIPYIIFVPLIFIYSWYWDPAYTSWLIAPIIPGSLLWTGPVQMLSGLGLVWYDIVKLFRSFLSGTCIFIVVRILMKDRLKQEHTKTMGAKTT
jgi:hypothetical protein